MARARPTDTRARIQAVARELFTEKGVQQTSLRDIADRLGITKPALYYHFDSREALVESLLQPIVDETEAFLAAREGAAEPPGPRLLLGEYFDLLFRHRDTLTMVVRDLSTFGSLELSERVFDWRHRLFALVLGPEPPLALRVRAVVAFGGLSDCAVEFSDVPAAKLRAAAVEAAWAALDLPVRATKRRTRAAR